jgi:hypothetical protein
MTEEEEKKGNKETRTKMKKKKRLRPDVLSLKGLKEKSPLNSTQNEQSVSAAITE